MNIQLGSFRLGGTAPSPSLAYVLTIPLGNYRLGTPHESVR
jgi:hypothetical protein